LSHRTDLVEKHAEAELYGLYISSNNQIADIELRMNHTAPECRSNQLVKGIAAGEGIGVFTGMVFVDKEAQKTDATQQNRNLQLDDTARIYTRPQLEIYADDVKCGHGATVGRLNEEEIYYMRQRGISEDTARRMQMQGFAADIIDRSHSAAFREYVSAKVEERIDSL
jgi:Fe-S cluster assembly protein SufD